MMKTWAITDVGLVRKENQDAYRIARGGDVCVVCDGCLLYTSDAADE